MPSQDDAPGPVGFAQKAPPSPPATGPAPGAKSPPAAEAPTTEAEPPRPHVTIEEPRGLWSRFRALAGGGRLGSPEGRLPLGLSRSIRESSSSPPVRRVVDASATGVRAATDFLDNRLGDATGKDWLATSSECYEIGAPLAGYLTDKAEEAELAAELADRAPLAAFALRAAAYLLRVLFGLPGGRAELDTLRDDIAEKLAKASVAKPDPTAPSPQHLADLQGTPAAVPTEP